VLLLVVVLVLALSVLLTEGRGLLAPNMSTSPAKEERRRFEAAPELSLESAMLRDVICLRL